MLFDALVRHIDAATPAQLRDIACAVLRWEGHDARITDGPFDGGADLRLYGADGAALPVVVAVSVERAWDTKLRSDARKAKQKLGVDRVYFVSSRRIPEASFGKVAAELLREGMTVTRYDQQTIASVAQAEGRVSDLIDLLGVPAMGATSERPVARAEEAAFAFAFFSGSAATLRSEVRERAVEIAVHQLGGAAELATLAQRLPPLLGVALDDGEVRSVVDRLRQSGRLGGRNGQVELPAAGRSTLEGLARLRAAEQAALESALAERLATWGVDGAAVLSSLWPHMGAALLPGEEILRDHAGSRRSLRRMAVVLAGHGLDPLPRLADLLEIAGQSPLARHLRAGAVLQALQALPATGLSAALGTSRPLRWILDASVAIPLLCVLFHGPAAGRRFFWTAESLYRRAVTHGQSLAVPSVWLEEVASHLVAARDYAEVAEIDREGMRGSQNAFVAYFAAAGPLTEFPTLPSFLASFGLAGPPGGDFARVRRHVEGYLATLLQRYGIAIVDTPADPEALRDVQTDWAWRFRDDPRPVVTARHDQQVVAWLRAPAREPEVVVVSWDRRLPDLAPPGRSFDPIGALDLLGLLQRDPIPDLALRFVASALAEEQTDRVAAVWDELVRMERGNLSDAALAERARGFKEEYLRGRSEDVDLTDLRRAWERARAG